MPINNNLAYPYVKAIFTLAAENNDFQTWEKLLTIWASTVQMFPHLFSTNQIISKPKQLELLLSVCAAVSVDTSEVTRNLLKLLVAKKQLLLLPKIAMLYQKSCAKHKQILILKVICATELSEAQKRNLKTRLEIRLKSQLQLSYQIDPNLIGGIKIYFSDQVIDLSISGQLQRLKAIINC